MRPAMVAMDIGDVLVATCPNRQYRRLEERSGIAWRRWKDAVDTGGWVVALEEGRIELAEFTDRACRAVGTQTMDPQAFAQAWNEVVGARVEPMVAVAAHLAAQGRLVFASNTSASHWARAGALLGEAGVEAPACLSFAVGARKPHRAFFEALSAAAGPPPEQILFVDDRAENVDAARDLGFQTLHHTQADVSVRVLEAVL